MKKVSLSGSPRANVGSKDASLLRKAERIPCVVYGTGEQIHFSVKEIDLKKIIWNPEVFNVELNIDGKTFSTIVKDVQFHPVTDRLVHVDFLSVVPGKPFKVKLPVRITGTAEGVKKGGKLIQNFRKMLVWGTIDKMPDAIEVNVDALEIGSMIRVKDVALEGIKLLEAPEAVIAAVKVTRNVAAEEETKAAAPATPAAAAATPAAAKPEAKK
jgi:large subunit ribosomal protein L25